MVNGSMNGFMLTFSTDSATDTYDMVLASLTDVLVTVYVSGMPDKHYTGRYLGLHHSDNAEEGYCSLLLGPPHNPNCWLPEDNAIPIEMPIPWSRVHHIQVL
jgi:hypothetical protein